VTLPDDVVYNADAFNINKLFVAAATYTRPIGRVTSTSMLTLSRHELDPQSGYWNVYSNMERSYKYAYGSMAKAEQQFSWKASPSLTITTGGTFERFFSIPQGADLNAPIVSQDVPGTILDTNITDDFVKLHYSNTGAFVQLQAVITPRVTLTLGARGDYNTRFGATFNPRVGLVARPAAGTTVKLLYGTAYLAPSPYQEYTHFGSFYSTDGGQTYASGYWHLGNPDLQPQQKKTVEVNLLQGIGGRFQLTASAFYSRLTDLLQQSDADRAYAGLYHGWPVDYIDFAVNEGHATRYGGTTGLEYLYVPAAGRRIEAHAALAFANGHDWEQDADPQGLPIGAMSPLQLRFGADVDWDRWSIAPRLAVVGTQRLVATVADGSARQTIDGYAIVDVNVRRRLFQNFDAFMTIENALDRRYRTINTLAYLNPVELIGTPQNPRRVTIGFELRIR
jgi:outer membrane receptor protein involved in Fe transport